VGEQRGAARGIRAAQQERHLRPVRLDEVRVLHRVADLVAAAQSSAAARREPVRRHQRGHAVDRAHPGGAVAADQDHARRILPAGQADPVERGIRRDDGHVMAESAERPQVAAVVLAAGVRDAGVGHDQREADDPHRGGPDPAGAPEAG